MNKILLLVFLALTSAFEVESGFECPEFDLLYGGPDYHFLEIYNVVTWEDCGRICALTTNCNFWSYQYTNKCFLYEDDTGIQYNADYISGERGCPEDNC